MAGNSIREQILLAALAFVAAIVINLAFVSWPARRAAGWSFGLSEKLPESYGREAEAVKWKNE